MDYDSYGSNAVELAIDLANADRAADPDWATAFLRAHDEWFAPGTVGRLSPDEAGQAATTEASPMATVVVSCSWVPVPGREKCRCRSPSWSVA